MKATGHDDHATERVAYTTPSWVQAWFLRRSRDNWKKKYMDVKADNKRLQNRANDVGKSREHWRDETERLRQRVHNLESENAALLEQLAALKKGRRPAGS